MGAFDNLSDITHAVGNVNLPRVTNPTIRGSIRRHDPDGTHASPYFLGLSGTSLSIQIGGVGAFVANFTSNLMEDALTTINALSPSNLLAEDDDGYLSVKNLNGGGTNWIQINSGTAASILGYAISPEPSSFSGAGDLANASPGRGITSTQNNPQGTQLLGQDEDLSTSAINRAIYGALRQPERFLKDLDKVVPVWKKYSVTVSVQPTTGNKIFVINDSTLRIPIEGFGITGSGPSSFILDQLVRLKDTNDNDYLDITQSDPLPHVSMIIYNDGTLGVADNAHTFVTWGTPDGKSIFGAKLQNKQTAVNITSIRGNIIEADTATFQTNVTQVGDTVVVEGATNNTPFSHIGEFVVTEVIDETRIAVRAKSFQDESYNSNGRPTELNPSLPGGTVYGTVRVIFGAYVPAQHATFVVPSWVPTGSYIARVLCGVRVRDLQAGDFGSQVSANNEGVASVLYNHITAATTGFRHHAADVDALAVSGTPHSLSGGTVATQLAALLGFLNPLTDATGITISGRPSWFDGTTNPPTTLDAAISKIITDLVASAGSARIGSAANSYISAGSINDQIITLATFWGELARASTWTEAQTFNGASGDSNPGIITSSTPSLRKLLWQFATTYANGVQGRIYASNGIEFVVNASWVLGTEWVKDDLARMAFRVKFTADHGIPNIRVDTVYSTTATTWNDSGWNALDLSLITNTGSELLTLNIPTNINGDVTLGTNNNVIVSGTGNYKRDSKSRHFSAAGGSISGGSIGNGGIWNSSGAGQTLDIPINVNEGEHIVEIKAIIRGDSSQTVSMKGQSNGSPSSAYGAFSATATSSASNTDQTLDITTDTLSNPLDEAITSTYSAYNVRFTSIGAPGGSGVFVSGVMVFTKVP